MWPTVPAPLLSPRFPRPQHKHTTPFTYKTIYGVSSKGQVKMSMTNIDFECLFSPSGSFSENTAFNMQTTIIWLYHSAAKIGFGINWGFYIASIYIIVTFLFCLWFLYMDVITCRKSGVWSVFGQRPVHCHNQLSVWLPLMRDQIPILWYVWALKLLSNVRNPSVIWTDRSLYLTLQCILRDSAEGGGFKMMKAYV